MAKTDGTANEKVGQRWTREDARQILSALKSSGLSAYAFAKREGLDPDRLYRWQRRLEAAASSAKLKKANRPKFVEVATVAVPAIEVEIRSGEVIRVPDGFCAECLRRLLGVLVEMHKC